MSSSKLSVGIVGLPNVGKSTLFNALLKKQAAYAANFPFATIEPNVGVVPVPDERLSKLAKVVKTATNMDNPPPEVPATIEFNDIAGLIAGAHKGEGLGNKFLAHIRQADAILHVVRAFTNPDIVKEGSVDPASDLEIIETELMMADLATLENQEKRLKRPDTETKFKSAVAKAVENIQKGTPVRNIQFDDQEREHIKALFLLSDKPILVALNVDEASLKDSDKTEKAFAQKTGIKIESIIAVSAKIEAELASLSAREQKEYLKDLGVETSGLERIIKKAFATLDLMTFLTAGQVEVRAWTIKKGTSARDASGVIHTDFRDKFIKADVTSFANFVKAGGWQAARENGLVRQEGRDYIMQEGDVVEFKIGG